MGLKIFEMMEMITRYLLTSVLKTISDRKVDQAGEFEKIFRLGPDLPVLCFDFFSFMLTPVIPGVAVTRAGPSQGQC